MGPEPAFLESSQRMLALAHRAHLRYGLEVKWCSKHVQMLTEEKGPLKGCSNQDSPWTKHNTVWQLWGTPEPSIPLTCPLKQDVLGLHELFILKAGISQLTYAAPTSRVTNLHPPTSTITSTGQKSWNTQHYFFFCFTNWIIYILYHSHFRNINVIKQHRIWNNIKQTNCQLIQAWIPSETATQSH